MVKVLLCSEKRQGEESLLKSRSVDKFEPMKVFEVLLVSSSVERLFSTLSD